MDDVVNRLAREIVEAITATVAADPRVEACREKGRAAGYEMQVSLEAVIGFASRQGIRTASENTASENTASENTASENTASENTASENTASENTATDEQVPEPSGAIPISDNDRRFLRSLRIAVDDVDEKTEEVE